MTQVASNPLGPQSQPGNRKSAISTLCAFADDIKIHHTVFAMPFALLAAFMAAGGMPRLGVLLLILVCMVTARTIAMSANRLLDAKLDAINPRTARRAIPSGRLSNWFFAAAIASCAAVFMMAAVAFWLFYRNVWPLVFAIPVLGFVSAYPLLKRFTRLCHYYLGAALALAPVCAWVAVRGSLALPPILMAGAVLCWTAGFDIIYACQDYDVDLKCGLFSVPSKLGIGRALWVARLTHLAGIAFLVALGMSSQSLGALYFGGVALAVVLLLIEHSLVKPHDLSKVGLAFFTLNGVISLALGTLGILDIFLRRS
jgi:4-hydroxybenzoate polyprenyltransferase